MYILHIDSQDYSSYRLTNDDESIQLNSPDLIKTLFHARRRKGQSRSSR